MVSPVYIIVAGLGTAFLLGLLKEESRTIAYGLTLTALAFMSWVAGSWLWSFAVDGSATFDTFMAGYSPPFAINLRMGLTEAALSLLVCLSGLLSAVYMQRSLLRLGRRAMAVLLILIMALCGIILTRDVFNLFVFIELMVIATAGLVLLSEDRCAVGAGFKYLIISEVITVLLLIGIIFAYHLTGTLNIDGMADAELITLKGGSLALFLMFIAVVAELKPFPANGWALDIYESAHPGFSAIFSAAIAGGAVLFAVDKLLLIGGPGWYPVAVVIGILSFVAANLLALPQTNDRRLLGYSSVAQVGLMLTILGLQDILGENYLFIAGGILLSHAVAKAGLYWLSGLVEERELSAWATLRNHPVLVLSFITFVAMLTGLPPFPGFYAKWELIHVLANEGRLVLLGLILFGALVEAGYLFRWFGYIIKHDPDEEKTSLPRHKLATVIVAMLAGWSLGYLWGDLSAQQNLLQSVPLLFALAFLLLEGLPVRVKNILAIAGLLGWFAVCYPSYDPLQTIFGAVMLVGGAVILLASFYNTGSRPGFYPSAMLMYAGLAMLIVAKDTFAFFAAWEILTIGSYFLILRGKRSEPHALSYILFSLGGAFLILAAFALAAQGQSPIPLTALANVSATLAPWVFVLLAIGFMTKTASVGLHIWLPGAHAEA